MRVEGEKSKVTGERVRAECAEIGLEGAKEERKDSSVSMHIPSCLRTPRRYARWHTALTRWRFRENKRLILAVTAPRILVVRLCEKLCILLLL